MNVVQVELQMAQRFEEAFRQRASQVERAPGFISFEVLRAKEGSEYIVVMRWQSEVDFENWMQSESFAQAHHGGGSGAAMSMELKRYDVVQHVSRRDV
jgi:heme-degrading monooxygenase HmoA